MTTKIDQIERFWNLNQPKPTQNDLDLPKNDLKQPKATQNDLNLPKNDRKQP